MLNDRLVVQNKKKIAITGHTQGLGKALYNHYLSTGFVVEGFSRTNGYDIGDPVARARLVEQLADHDIFINNAQSAFAQTDLLYAVFERWQKQSKTIVNISSNASDGIKNFPYPYATSKTALDKACEQLNNTPRSLCKVVNIRPGWIATERIKEMRITDPCLEVKTIVEIIDFILELPTNIHITSLSISAR